jgi:hypothetical protein
MGMYQVPRQSRILWHLCVVEAFGLPDYRERWVLLQQHTMEPLLRIGWKRKYRAGATALQPLLDAGIVLKLRTGSEDVHRGAVHRLTPWREWVWPTGKVAELDAYLARYLQPEERTDGNYKTCPLQGTTAQRLARLMVDRIPAHELTADHPTASPDDLRWRQWVERMQMLLWRGYSPTDLREAMVAAYRDPYWCSRLQDPDGAEAFYHEFPTFFLRSRAMKTYTPEIGDAVRIRLGRGRVLGTVVDIEPGRLHRVIVRVGDREYTRSPVFVELADDAEATP